MLKVRAYDPARQDKRSDAQKRANDRSFRIFNLRGLACLAHRLTGPRRDAVIAAVDEELALIGAKPTAIHQMERDAAEERRWADANTDKYDDIPF